jgi:NAD kinase
MPESNGIILTPVAPHNLNVRPFVLSNSAKVSLSAEARDPDFLMTLDSRSFTVPCGTIVELTRAHFELHLVAFPEQSFFQNDSQQNGLGPGCKDEKRYDFFLMKVTFSLMCVKT